MEISQRQLMVMFEIEAPSMKSDLQNVKDPLEEEGLTGDEGGSGCPGGSDSGN